MGSLVIGLLLTWLLPLVPAPPLGPEWDDVVYDAVVSAKQQELRELLQLQHPEVDWNNKPEINEEGLDDEVIRDNYIDDQRLTIEQVEDQVQALKEELGMSDKRRRKRKVTIKKWNLPVIYEWSGDHDSSQKQKIMDWGIKKWEELTCIRFREKTAGESPRFYIRIAMAGGCYSYVGPSHAGQTVSLDEHCIGAGTVAHEFGHALGMWHEQSRPDRDDYVTINFANIPANKEHNFAKQSFSGTETHDVEYDTGSIMHYSQLAFSINFWGGDKTIVTKSSDQQNNIGQRSEVSFQDAKAMNMHYCQDTCNSYPTLNCKNNGYQDPNDCHKCRCPPGLSGTLCDSPVSGSPDSCGGHLILNGGNQGSIESPNYPDRYIAGQVCSWLFQAPAGETITVEQVGAVSMPCSVTKTCSEYVEVRYGRNLGVTGARVCSCQKRGAFTSETNRMLVLMKSYPGGSGSTGFQMRYSVSGSSTGGGGGGGGSLTTAIVPTTTTTTEPELVLAPVDRVECREDSAGLTYTGTESTTWSGYTCQRWDSQSPHSHFYNADSMFPDGSVQEAENYCRNPQKWSWGLWCYTTDPNISWDLCVVPSCSSVGEHEHEESNEDVSECKRSGPGVEYAGKTDTTASGRRCQAWAAQEPHSHPFTNPAAFPDGDIQAAKNYCRNPSGLLNGPWCYVDSTDGGNVWELCDIAECD